MRRRILTAGTMKILLGSITESRYYFYQSPALSNSIIRISSENWIDSIICTNEPYKLLDLVAKLEILPISPILPSLLNAGRVKTLGVRLEEMMSGIRMLVSIVIIV